MQIFKNKRTDMYFWLGMIYIYICMGLLIFNEGVMNLKNNYYRISILKGGGGFTYEQNPTGFIVTEVSLLAGFIFSLYGIWVSYKVYKERKKEVNKGFD